MVKCFLRVCCTIVVESVSPHLRAAQLVTSLTHTCSAPSWFGVKREHDFFYINPKPTTVLFEENKSWPDWWSPVTWPPLRWSLYDSWEPHERRGQSARGGCACDAFHKVSAAWETREVRRGKSKQKETPTAVASRNSTPSQGLKQTIRQRAPEWERRNRVATMADWLFLFLFFHKVSFR